MYYLWLIPSADVYDALTRLITRLGHEHDGPCFEPHITLLADIETDEKTAIDKTDELASQISAFKVNVDRIEAQDRYYRSLYLKLEKSAHLLAARHQAEVMFNQETASDYMPHISLLYGDQPQAIKQHLIESLSEDVPEELMIDRLVLIFSQGGPPETWKTVSIEQL